MPPIEKINKQMILKAAFDLVREHGIEKLNTRSIADRLNCSTQPVFSQFGSMALLKQELFDYTCSTCISQVIEHSDKPDFLPRTTRWYINLIRNERHLFRFLYFSDGFSGSLMDFLLNHESNLVMISQLMSLYSLSEETCQSILLRSFLFLHGIGSLLVNNKIQMEDSEIAEMVRLTVKDMVTAARSGGN